VFSVRSDFWTIVRPAKAGMFSGRQSHRGKSWDSVAWVAFAEETKWMEPTEKAILGMVSESPGRNALDAKCAGARSAGNPHATCGVAGTGIPFTVRLLRHSQRKRGATDRPDLQSNGASPRPYRDQIIPTVEKTFRTSTKPDDRALGGSRWAGADR
jgi:hypothetical protein